MNELESARAQIEKIDKEIAELFEKRMIAARTVASYKKERGLSVKDAARENELIDKNRAYIKDADILEYYVQLQKKIMSLSCAS